MTRVHQADFSAEQSGAQAASRLPRADGHQERPEGAGAPPRQGPQAPQRLADDTQPVAIERLRKRAEFLYVAEGFAERCRTLVVQARRRAEPRPSAGLGITATRKVGGSVVRNRARRRLREGGRLLLPKLGLFGVDYVLIARQDTGDCPWARLLDDLENALLSLRRRLSAGDDAPRPRASTKG